MTHSIISMTDAQAESFMTFTIAIDGPAAAGKGTLSRRIAETYGFHHLDTGLTYRATAKALLDAGLPLDDEAVAEKMALEVDLAGLDRAVLSRHDIGEAASKIAVMTPVRRALVKAQQRFALKEPGTVLDGRDIGTVVCPQAPVKLYVTASADVRARRRYDEILANGGSGDYDAIFTEVKKRDERDMGRADSPLKPAEDAHLLDTSEMSIEAAFQAARTIIDAALEKQVSRGTA
ncbi:cytidylate kinase [Agrobacterium tumefaciens]|jgi:cytidylate kinase|uniref:Cytidylate kinase n=2 Tax=Rhizobium/Agrobacterium group TaxID=227290 RepID=A0AAW8M0G7_AGRTU|nr:cytidylate kinase [Agrobacterium tumefaciens]MBB4408909.1 cytidylate kinase [Agrobacterium radiobacter]CUX39862.1 Cytidylate kinase (CK) (Cytidine monophosphate kinase) (CMP kinase) [Agrobacterium tumefaciens str. CFBP 5621]MBB4454515.1 cytidylate kinase [Agrobacterium radiobacter]MBP2510518.1 cytidylate kinase [Agrobacterium tumefaciens]